MYRTYKTFPETLIGVFTLKLKVIIPNSGMSKETLKERELMLKSVAAKETEISVDCIEHGPESIESNYDEILAGKYTIDKVINAEREGYDAIIIYCGSDPAIAAAREAVNIPVVGPGKISMLIANDLAYKFSILTVLDQTIPHDEELVRKLGIDVTRLASVRSINIPVSDVRNDMEKTFNTLLEEGKKAIEVDGAHALVLGCLGMAGVGKRLQEALNVPVIDPAFLAIKYAELLVTLNLKQSKKSYPIPPEKIRF